MGRSRDGMLGWPYHASEATVRSRLPEAARGDPIPGAGTLAGRTFVVLLWNGVIVYGVFRLGWDPATVVLLFLAEAWVALATDLARVLLPALRARLHIDQTDGPAFPWTVFGFETLFIGFFSVFCLLGLAPGSDLIDTAANARELVAARLPGLQWPIALVAFFQLEQLARDVLARPAPGASKAVHLRAGGWMFLIFFSVMAYPLLDWMGITPVGVALVMVALKSLGQLVGVWSVPLAARIPESPSAP